jgi:hypothetical protein
VIGAVLPFLLVLAVPAVLVIRWRLDGGISTDRLMPNSIDPLPSWTIHRGAGADILDAWRSSR